MLHTDGVCVLGAGVMCVAAGGGGVCMCAGGGGWQGYKSMQGKHTGTKGEPTALNGYTNT